MVRLGISMALAFEAKMNQDAAALNIDMNYIAVDLREMTQLTPRAKAALWIYLQTFGITIRDCTLEQWRQEENDEADLLPYSQAGIFLCVDKADIGAACALRKSAKYHSGTGYRDSGLIGVRRGTLEA